MTINVTLTSLQKLKSQAGHSQELLNLYVANLKHGLSPVCVRWSLRLLFSRCVISYRVTDIAVETTCTYLCNPSFNSLRSDAWCIDELNTFLMKSDLFSLSLSHTHKLTMAFAPPPPLVQTDYTVESNCCLLSVQYEPLSCAKQIACLPLHTQTIVQASYHLPVEEMWKEECELCVLCMY